MVGRDQTKRCKTEKEDNMNCMISMFWDFDFDRLRWRLKVMVPAQSDVLNLHIALPTRDWLFTLSC